MMKMKTDNSKPTLMRTVMEDDALGEGNERHVCTAITGIADSEWTVSAWFTDAQYQNRGYGSECLKECLRACMAETGKPERIVYVWNGENEYVLGWMQRRFDAECSCPLAVRKYSDKDDWESHQYLLNVDKVLEWMKI